jgi:hypothetical protein
MMESFDDHRLGETAGVVQVGTGEEVAVVTLRLMQQARRTVDLISRHLDPLIYDTDAFSDAARAFCLRTPHQRIRIVILDPRPVVARGHRLVDLVRSLSSFVEVRMPEPEFRSLNEAFFIADETGYVWRQFADRFEADIDFSGRRRAKELTGSFTRIWEKAVPDPNFRILCL